VRLALRASALARARGDFSEARAERCLARLAPGLLAGSGQAASRHPAPRLRQADRNRLFGASGAMLPSRMWCISSRTNSPAASTALALREIPLSFFLVVDRHALWLATSLPTRGALAVLTQPRCAPGRSIEPAEPHAVFSRCSSPASSGCRRLRVRARRRGRQSPPWLLRRRNQRPQTRRQRAEPKPARPAPRCKNTSTSAARVARRGRALLEVRKRARLSAARSRIACTRARSLRHRSI